MIRELHEKLINKEITSVELTERYFSVIEKREPEISAYLTLTKKLAFEQAKFVDEKISKGEEIDLIEGIPCAIKDNMCIDNTRTTAGSKILDNYIAPYDATIIKKLKEKGAVFLGKTNMDEFAMGSSTESSAYQVTKNPIDTQRVPGGSSGGSIAAVAAGEAVWSLGSDTGGSIRQPASFCGVVGLKPTYGRVSRNGLLAMASSLDQIGPVGSSVEDVAIILSRISGEDPLDATSAKSSDKKYEDYLIGNITGKIIGVSKEYLEGLDSEIKKVFEASLEKFKLLGAKIENISLPHSEYALPVYYIIMTSEVSSNLARFDGIKYGLRVNDDEDSIIDEMSASRRMPKKLLETYLDTRKIGFGDEVKRRIMLGTYVLSAGYYDAYYNRANAVRQMITNDFLEAFKSVDLVATPTAPSPAFKIGEKTNDPVAMYLEDIFTVTANLTGMPAISVPCVIPSTSKNQMPIGIQLTARHGGEETLFVAGKDLLGE